MRSRIFVICLFLMTTAGFLPGQGKYSTPTPRPYTPPPSHSTYTPPPSPPPSHSTYTPPSTTYHPPASTSSSGSYSPSRPSYPTTTGSSHSYSPGSGTSTSRGSSTGSGSSTTYTPHTYTPGSSSSAARPSSGPSSGASGAKVYVPGARTSAATNPSGSTTSSRAGTTYTPDPSHSITVANVRTAAYPRPAAMRPAYTVAPSGVASRTASGDHVLNAQGSNSVLHQINGTRATLTGVNKKPLPAGQVTTRGNGSLTITASAGVYQVRPNGTLASFKGNGRVVNFTPGGRVSSIHTNSMQVSKNVHGQRTVIVRRPDHSLVVSTGPRSGYVQKTIVTPQGTTLIQRTYVMNNVRVTRVYSTYFYNGVSLHHFIPAFYYAPVFYGWAYYPWDAPVSYQWGWVASPWLGFYSGYFAPWRVYPSPSYWLTDYMLSETLADAYRAGLREGEASRQEEMSSDDGPDQQDGDSDATYAQQATPITPELKESIAEEVRQQISYENAASGNPQEAANVDSLPQVMEQGHLFIVDQALTVATGDQNTCSLSAGDVLRLTSPVQNDSQVAELTVASSRQLDCPAGVQVSVGLQELQDMHDSFRARLSAGLQTLHDGQGQNGLPAAPKSAIAPPPRPSMNARQDDSDAASAVKSAQRDADQVEAQAADAAFSPAGPKMARTQSGAAR